MLKRGLLKTKQCIVLFVLLLNASGESKMKLINIDNKQNKLNLRDPTTRFLPNVSSHITWLTFEVSETANLQSKLSRQFDTNVRFWKRGRVDAR